MADERSGPNRGWIRNHLMQCTPACSHRHHHHHCQRVPDLENDRVGATLGLQRMHIIGNPSWVPLPITEITFFLLQFLSHLHLRTTRTFPWQVSRALARPLLHLFACLLVCCPDPVCPQAPFCGSTRVAALSMPGQDPPLLSHIPPSLFSSRHAVWYCCGSVQLMWHLSLARDHVLSPPPNKSCVTGLLGP